MIIRENLISEAEIIQLKNYFDLHKGSEYVNWKQENNKPLDIRLQIDEKSDTWIIIENIVKTFANDVTKIWSALQRQNYPHNIHIDDFDQPNPNVYTVVIALDTVPQFKTIVWQEKFDNNSSFKKYLFKINDKIKSLEKKSNISSIEDLEHTSLLSNNQMLCDYLTLDDIFSYKSGSGVLFSARKLHCTSNWTKYPQFEYRNLLQIHFSTEKFYEY